MAHPATPLRATLLGAALLLGTVAEADVLVPRRGRPAQGAIVRQTDTEVVFNIYWSRNPDVVNEEHLVRLPMAQVKSVERRPHPEVEVWRRWKEAKTADEFAAVGTYAKEHRLKGAARMCFAQALALDEGHAAAIKGIGGRSKWAREKKGNPMLDGELQALLERYVSEDDPAARKAMHRELKDRHFDAKPHELERWRRSAHQPTGLQEDRPLSWRSDVHVGAVYTLYVPEAYTPSRPWPLMIGLHGGGPDGKAGDEVVGSGPSAMNFYRAGAERHGFIVACPTALRAGWPQKVNEELVRDLITELRLLYHVDIDRIHMTGHSMGGFGTWGLGPRMAEDLAAISPMAGGGGSIGELVSTRTPVFIFHGADDQVVGPSSDRQLAKQLLETDHDFVYTELDGVGHGFPASVRRELFEFHEPRRRFDKRRRDAWPRSSFAGKVTREEATYLGDPTDEIEGRAPETDDLLDHLALGGGRAQTAVAPLIEHGGEDLAGDVAKFLRKPKVPFTGRAAAARVLGGLGGEKAGDALGRAVALPATREQSEVARACAQALKKLGHADALASLGEAVTAWTGYYEDKVRGDGMAYSDWRRTSGVLADLVDAWAGLARPEDEAAVLDKMLVQRVLAPGHQVATSSRVPQDPSVTRTALARAIARAYQRTNAAEARWTRLFEALASDDRARSAAEAVRDGRGP